jgi:ABC-type multidrug transport system permease subunit
MFHFRSDLFSIVFCRLGSTVIAVQQVAAGMVPFVFGIFVLFTGFIVQPPSIPNWWIWLYYVNPFRYAQESCMINELVGSKYHCAPSEMLPPPYYPTFSLPYPLGFDNNAVCPITEGVQQLEILSAKTDLAWRWVYLIIMLGFSAAVVMLNLVAAVKITNTGNTVCLFFFSFFFLYIFI